ncbi:hypothetical protein DQ04_03641010 [Trypanosoma grayi]|uniref:hypothetical protein n=1 Tax=Trypanosoma grayi TaxID=71804 RepID=UPI0004F48157|nr:hypothetical protein DQ04_03641010 [Trypanosoma grayi]KEG10494.1 hypothetical protein DQ04_03641010 [Trypanosoma grayi]
MTTLSKGEFVFLGEKRQLLLLEKDTDRGPHIIYGGELLAFACSDDETVMALALPPQPGANACVVRLYGFKDNELGDALGELTSPNVTQLLWAGPRHLVVCGPSGCTIYTWNKEKLKFFVRDAAIISFMQADRVALYYETSQTLQYWNLDTNRMMDSVKLSLRGHRLVSVFGAGYFGFALYEDGTVQVFYVTKSNIKKLELFDRLLPVAAVESTTYGAPPLLVACAISSRRVLLGLRGDSRVHRMEYKNERLVVNSMQENLPPLHALMALSRDGQRCLAFNTSTCRYHELKLSLGTAKTTGNEAKERQKVTAPNADVDDEKSEKGRVAGTRKEERRRAAATVVGDAAEMKTTDPTRRTARNGTTGGTETPTNNGDIKGSTLAFAGAALVVIAVLALRILSR